MSGKIAGFKDIMPPPSERLDVVARDRDGNVVQVISNLGSPSEERKSTLPVGSRRLGDAGEEESK